MSDTTPNFGLPYILPSQAQKHVTHNEALRMLDGLVQISINDRDLTAPPAQPDEGDSYLIPDAASGEWAGSKRMIAAWQDGAWSYFMPRPGWLAWVVDEARLMVFDGETWIDAPCPAQTPLLGVNAQADATNRLVVASAATLFTHTGNGHQHKINKAAAADTASLLFQTNWSGRAEMGTLGDDKWRLKVSSDGAIWRDAITVDQTTGKVAFPSGGVREILTANRTYYVRTDGNDGNTGAENSSAGAFVSIQKAIDRAATLDLGNFDITIVIGPGTYAIGAGLVARQMLGAGRVFIVGDATNPANVTLSTSGLMNGNQGTLFADNITTIYRITGIRLLSTATGQVHGLFARRSKMEFGSIIFGAGILGHHLRCEDLGSLVCVANYAIAAGCAAHMNADTGSTIRVQGFTLTLAGTPAFLSAFAYADTGANLIVVGNIFIGGATGIRFDVRTSAVILTLGPVSHLPGNAAGTQQTGGQYA